mmetsp:Transcript_10706/g.31803  ORF Transcript_10706/g.31803 Transcript_10706/m.31803 type:complete len:288 (-) Transcript_10706:84-947(-)
MDFVPLAALAIEACLVLLCFAAAPPASTFWRLAAVPKASSWSFCSSASWAQTFSAPLGRDARPGNTSASATPLRSATCAAHSSATYSQTVWTARSVARREGPTAAVAGAPADAATKASDAPTVSAAAAASTTAATRRTFPWSQSTTVGASASRTRRNPSPRSFSSQNAPSGPRSRSSKHRSPSWPAAATTCSSGTNCRRVADVVRTESKLSRASYGVATTTPAPACAASSTNQAPWSLFERWSSTRAFPLLAKSAGSPPRGCGRTSVRTSLSAGGRAAENRTRARGM